MDSKSNSVDAEQESAGQLVDRTAAERDEWAVASDLAAGLERARLALAVGARRVEHAAAEGIAYV